MVIWAACHFVEKHLVDSYFVYHGCAVVGKMTSRWKDEAPLKLMQFIMTKHFICSSKIWSNVF